MERARLAFADRAHPSLSGVLSLDDAGRIVLRASPELDRTLRAALTVPRTELGPLHFDDIRRGLTLAISLRRGVRAGLLHAESLSGAFELRAFVSGDWVRLTLAPGDFDPDDAWGFVLAMHEAKLEAPRA
ncbi:MAG TPA: hypothetical protein VJ400_09255 [Thermoplasmata archaeon]|nr:hypothetical protein [Thermoplasmata archaeon]